MRLGSVGVKLAILVVWIAAFTGLYHVVQAHMNNPASNLFALVGYCAALVALAGWMVQSFVAMRNSRKQHTMNVLLQTRLNEIPAKHIKQIDKTFPNGADISYAELSKEENRDAYESVRWILNYYEFVATGIRHGDLDENLMCDCICSQLCVFCKRADDVIRNVRSEDDRGRPTIEKARVLRSLRKLQRRWQGKIDRRTRRPRWWPF